MRAVSSATVETLVVELLSCESTPELPLSRIAEVVEEQLGVHRLGCYSVIRQSEHLETVVLTGSDFKLCRLKGRSRATYPQLQRIRNREWATECKRGLKQLTVEHVDLGLFVLGRLFDQAMKQLLETGREAGLSVSEKSLGSLKNRIDWALREGIFSDKVNLNLLKNERNDRGHETPTMEEREASLKFAPYLAGLYLDYLGLIERQIRMWKGLPEPEEASSKIHPEDFAKQLATGRKKTKSSAGREDTGVRTTDARKLQRLLKMTNRQLGELVCKSLKGCPNHSIKKANITAQFCKDQGIQPRGQIREELTMHLHWSLAHLEKKGRIKEYQAKNIRIKLVA